MQEILQGDPSQRRSDEELAVLNSYALIKSPLVSQTTQCMICLVVYHHEALLSRQHSFSILPVILELHDH